MEVKEELARELMDLIEAALGQEALRFSELALQLSCVALLIRIGTLAASFPGFAFGVAAAGFRKDLARDGVPALAAGLDGLYGGDGRATHQGDREERAHGDRSAVAPQVFAGPVREAALARRSEAICSTD
jgi:hypothetical protein